MVRIRSKMSGSRSPMPIEIRDVLERQGLMQAYLQRPIYQQQDYLGWLARAKMAETRQQRLQQMLRELQAGDSYIGMRWSARLDP